MPFAESSLREAASAAYERSKQAHEEHVSKFREAKGTERAIALQIKVREALGVEVAIDSIDVSPGPQTWLNACVDVDGVTLATVGYIGAMKLHVLFRCKGCNSRRVSLFEVTDLASLGFTLDAPRFVDPCRCRPVFTPDGLKATLETGGVRPCR